MKKYETDKSFLARWIANELSEEELAEFKQTDAYKDFTRINEVAQQFKAPQLDIQKSLANTKAKMNTGKIRKLNTKVWYSIAASIAILITLFFGLNSTKTYTTGIGEQLAIVLPDGSKVQLNANATLAHKRFFWNTNRTLDLQGEAYFEVTHGNDFKVKTTYGDVTVLGTKFNVKSRAHIFELNCFEGKVKFEQNNSSETRILEAFDKISIQKGIINEQINKTNGPEWLGGISIFKNRPLQEVLNELSSFYNITFTVNQVDITQRFSGSFVHNNLENALKTTLTPMGVVYTISKNQKVITLQ